MKASGDGRSGRRDAADAFGPDAFRAATGVSRETAERFEAWRALLDKWCARINLVGPATKDDFWRRHALDSVQVLDVAPRPAAGVVQRWADLGSGAGFPGLAVALAAADVGRTVEVHLIEASAKRAAFLREAARATGAPVVVRAMKAEDLAGERFDVITARAFAPLTRLFAYAESLWKNDTVGVFLKGREAEVELTDAAKSWRFHFDTRPSRSDPNGQLVRIEGLEHVQDA